MNLPQRIRQLRMQNGLTQSVLANKLGVTPRMVSHFEQGTKIVQPEVLEKLSEIFAMSVNDIMQTEGAARQIDDQVEEKLDQPVADGEQPDDEPVEEEAQSDEPEYREEETSQAELPTYQAVVNLSGNHVVVMTIQEHQIDAFRTTVPPTQMFIVLEADGLFHLINKTHFKMAQFRPIGEQITETNSSVISISFADGSRTFYDLGSNADSRNNIITRNFLLALRRTIDHHDHSEVDRFMLLDKDGTRILINLDLVAAIEVPSQMVASSRD